MVPIARGSMMERPRLRVWLVSQSYLPFHGGITEHVWHLADGLARRGHEVTILTGNGSSRHEPDGTIPTGNASSRHEPDPPDVRVVRIGRTFHVPSHGAQACVTAGLRWGARLRRSLGQPPDIVHIQSPLEPFLPLWALHRLPGVKIGTFHTGGDEPHWGYRYFSPWLRGVAHRLDARIAVSREAERFVSRHFAGEYAIIPNGVDATRFNHAPARGVANGRGRNILFVGRLDPRKGLDTLMNAFAAIHCAAENNGCPRPRLTLVGHGPARTALERRAREDRLPVSFAGDVARDELPHWYRAADLFVAPSTGGESFGISLLEALAAGLPLAAADIPGYRETLQGAAAVRFFMAGCASSLAAALHESLRDDSNESGRDGIRERNVLFLRRYSWPSIASRTEDLYLEALQAAAWRNPEAGRAVARPINGPDRWQRPGSGAARNAKPSHIYRE